MSYTYVIEHFNGKYLDGSLGWTLSPCNYPSVNAKWVTVVMDFEVVYSEPKVCPGLQHHGQNYQMLYFMVWCPCRRIRRMEMFVTDSCWGLEFCLTHELEMYYNFCLRSSCLLLYTLHISKPNLNTKWSAAKLVVVPNTGVWWHTPIRRQNQKIMTGRIDQRNRPRGVEYHPSRQLDVTSRLKSPPDNGRTKWFTQLHNRIHTHT